MHDIEKEYAEVMLGGADNDGATDAYKNSMGQAGFPLRTETFYLSFRAPGPWYIPFDLAAVVQALLSLINVRSSSPFLDKFGYTLTPAMRAAFDITKVNIWAAPKGAWVNGREPILTITGPSYLVSWLEPLVIMLHFPIQVATAIAHGRRRFDATCAAEADLFRLIAGACGVNLDIVYMLQPDYTAAVTERVKSIVTALKGEADRAFEVGMRAATCMQMHERALRVCKEYGIVRTSNIYLAEKLDMIPIGTMGHEHPQRWLSDALAYRALRDMRPATPFYLPDTYSALKSGIPTAYKVMNETPLRAGFIRFDDRNCTDQIELALQFEARFNLKPGFAFEDGQTNDSTVSNEMDCDRLGIARNRRIYGYGGFIVCAADWIKYHRNNVSAVYKLAQTGPTPVMKFSTPAKESAPGIPVIFRRDARLRADPDFADYDNLIGQFGETPPAGFALLTAENKDQVVSGAAAMQLGLSAQTAALRQVCVQRLNAMLQEAAGA